MTLPFAAFTGLASTIAFVIGPVGWLGVGAYATVRVTSTDWEALIPAVVYTIGVRAQSQDWGLIGRPSDLRRGRTR